MMPRDDILLIGKSLNVGQSINSYLCPWCEGGQSKEAGFSVTRTEPGLVAYNCHRAKCGRRGYITTSGGGASLDKTWENIFKPNPYPIDAYPLSLEDMKTLDAKYGIDLEMVYKAGWMRANTSIYTMLLPVWSPLGALRGHVSRQERPSGSKDVKSWKILDETWLCWYRTSFRDIVVVEDQISACKAASFATSVSLLGTGLSPEKAEEIKAVSNGGKVWLALDKDASTRTFDYLKQYRTFFNGNLFGLMLSKDIKNMSYEEIRKLQGPFEHA